MDKYDQLEKIKKLLDDGVITQEEFESEKNKILSGGGRSGSSAQYWGMQESEYCMFMHLSQFLGLLAPVVGLIMPIVMWAMAKDYSKSVDAHGRIIFNWMLSCIIYLIISIILIVAIIGVPLLIGLVVVNFVFVILGAVKARNGEQWEYPASIPFFRRPDSNYSAVEE